MRFIRDGGNPESLRTSIGNRSRQGMPIRIENGARAGFRARFNDLVAN